MITLLAALAGGLGAAVRFLVDAAVRSRWGHRLPWGTTVINLSGSAVLGLLTGLVAVHVAPTAMVRIAGSGFLGGYTTFSTATLETVRLLQDGRRGAALTHAAVNLGGSLTLAAAGLALAGLG